ncbi:MAG: hypothetical protein R3C44_21180 [Chloroflexota bacterium]
MQISTTTGVQVFMPEIATALDDGQSRSFVLLPTDYLISRLVPDGWSLDNISCERQPSWRYNSGVDPDRGDNVTCTFNNVQAVINVCPANDPGVGNERTDIIGIGMGDTRRAKKVAKLTIPYAMTLTALYGQGRRQAGRGLIKYLRFIYPNKTYVNIQPETSLGNYGAVSWWGSDLDIDNLTRPYVKARWYIQGQVGSQTPAASVHHVPDLPDPRKEYALPFEVFDGADNWVADPGTLGFSTTQTFTLEIPETQGVTDVNGQLALVDNDRDTRGCGST